MEYFSDYTHQQQLQLIRQGYDINTIDRDGKSSLDYMLEDWYIESVISLADEVNLGLTPRQFDRIIRQYENELDKIDYAQDLSDCVELLEGIMDKIPSITTDQREIHLDTINRCKEVVAGLACDFY